jgi:hypothetical protein
VLLVGISLLHVCFSENFGHEADSVSKASGSFMYSRRSLLLCPFFSLRRDEF